MRTLFAICLLFTLLSFAGLISISRSNWSELLSEQHLYQKLNLISDAQRQLDSHQFTDLASLSEFSNTQFFIHAIPDWKTSRSYYLFNHINLPELDEGVSLKAWHEETRAQIEKQKIALDKELKEKIDSQKKLHLILVFITAFVLFMTWISVYIWHRVRMDSILNKLTESNAYLKKKQTELTKANGIMASILEDLNNEKIRSTFSKLNDQRLTLVAKYSVDGLIGLDKSGFIISWNPKAESLFAKPESTMLHKPLHVLFDEEDNLKIKHASEALTPESPHSSTTVKWISTAAPVIQYLEISITALFGNKDILGYSVIVRDVSTRIQEIEQLRILIEATPNAILMSDSEGNIIQANGHAEKSFGYSKYELLSLNIDDLLPDNLRNSHKDFRRGYLSQPKIRRMGTDLALKAKRKDGSFIFVEVGLAPVKLNEKIFVISAITDISERIDAQRKLTEFNVSLSRKNREMEQFVYTVSHDLKAPLVTIAAFSKTIKKMLQDSDDDKLTHKIDRIIANSAQMEELITDLLEISRVMNRPLNISEFSLEGAINEITERLEQNLSHCNITFNIDQNLTLKASRQQIIQCLQNIIENAAKYTKDGIQPQIHIFATQDKKNSYIYVQDNGIGIDISMHEKIFDIFERGDVSTPGTGVGLAIAKSVVEKHGGNLTVKSSLGEGSTFTISIPNEIAI